MYRVGHNLKRNNLERQRLAIGNQAIIRGQDKRGPQPNLFMLQKG